jgi:hypothetical protein
VDDFCTRYRYELHSNPVGCAVQKIKAMEIEHPIQGIIIIKITKEEEAVVTS